MALAGRAVGRADQRVGHLLGIGIGQDHHVVLGAAERLHPLAVPGAGLEHVLGDRGRADEAHRGNVRMGQDGVDRPCRH